MKYFLSLFLLITLIACNDKKAEPLPASKTDSNNQAVAATPVNPVNPYATVDISPMDMSYYPVEYPKLKMSGKSRQGPLARVIYS